MTKRYNTGSVSGTYEIVRISPVTHEVTASLPGTYETSEDAWEAIQEHERVHRCQPGVDHGFGVGSGFQPRLVD